MPKGLPFSSWHKSSYSNDFDNACVEVSRSAHGVAVRDSKAPGHARLRVGAAAWTALTRSL